MESERRAVTGFVHSHPSPDPVAHRLGLPDSLIDFPADTTRTVAEMLYSNRFARTSSIKYIFSHTGGTIPYLAGLPTHCHRDVPRTLLDTALAVGDSVLTMLRSVVGLAQVQCGSDHPHFRRDPAVGCIATLKHTEEVAAREREADLGANALEALSSPRRRVGVPVCYITLPVIGARRNRTTDVGGTVSGLIMLARHPGPDVRGTIAQDNTAAGFLLSQKANGVAIRENQIPKI